MAILGAHMSIAGGFHKAVEAAAECSMDCVQIFTAAPQRWPTNTFKTAGHSGRYLSKNNNQWRARPIEPQEAELFKRTLREKKISHPIAHASYLINLASPDRELWKKSVDAMVEELHRAETIGLAYVVVHPGAYVEGSPASGIRRIVGRSTKSIAVPPRSGLDYFWKRRPGKAAASVAGSSTSRMCSTR